MKYLKLFFIVMLMVFTFGSAMAQQVVVKARVGVGGHYHHRHWHHRRHWHHHDDDRHDDDHH
jgi:hypothetical protein